MSSTIETLLTSLERLAGQIDWAEVENFARERQHPLTTEQRRQRRIEAYDARQREKVERLRRQAASELAEIDSALAELS